MEKPISTILKQLTPPLLWGIGTFFKKFRKRNQKSFFSIHGLDQKIEQYLPQYNGFYVELGANDGVSQSNTLYFERYKNWKGVLVEPTPHNYLKCLSNRSKDNYIACNACVSFDYKDRFVEILFSNLMTSSIGLESDIQDPVSHANAGTQFLEGDERVFSFGAVAKTLNEVLIEANAPRKIDFLSLDVEGVEIEVLKGVDHSHFRFQYLCIECQDLEKLKAYLQQYDYELVEQLSYHDYLFRDKRALTV